MSVTPVLAPQPGRRFDLLGVGECSLDTWLRVEALPAAGDKVAASEWVERPGGQVATAVLAAARLGLRTAYAGVVGDDLAAERALAGLREGGVDLAGVAVVRGARTRSAVISVEAATGERAVLGFRDPRLAAGREALAGVAPEAARLLLVDGSDLALALGLAERARAHAVPVLVDLDTPSPEAERLLAAAAFPIVSEGFARRGYGSPEAALDRCVALGARLAVVTLGRQGALARLGAERLASPACEVPVVDTTGAGDVFHGAFAAGLLRGLAAPELLRFANAAAAYACTRPGAQGALPTPSDVEALLYSSS